MAKKETLQPQRRSLYQTRRQRVKLNAHEIMSDFKENIEVVDSDGNITCKPRDFSQVDQVDDYKIDVLKETNPAMLDPRNICTMSGGTPLDAAETAAAFVRQGGNKVDSMTAQYEYEQSQKQQSEPQKEKPTTTE